MNKLAAADVAAEVVDFAVGQRLRQMRRERRLSLAVLAQRAGVSIGLLSQIERGLSSPSLRVLVAVADAFSVPLTALFPGPSARQDDAIVVHAKERAELKLWRAGIFKQLLTPQSAEARLTLSLVRLEPGASTGEELYSHQGEEAGLVLEGAIDLTVAERHFRVEAGESFRFPSTRPHRFSNPLDQVSLVVWANCLT
jgi:transcriptional regulator with XRE-family HTH domain